MVPPHLRELEKHNIKRGNLLAMPKVSLNINPPEERRRRKKLSGDSFNFGFEVVKLSPEEINRASTLMVKDIASKVGPIGKRRLRVQQVMNHEDSFFDRANTDSPMQEYTRVFSPKKTIDPQQQVLPESPTKSILDDFSRELLEKIPEKFMEHIHNRMLLEDFIEKIEKSKKVKNYNVLPVEIQNYIFRCV